MVKVLYVGVFDSTGYGHAAVDYALSLETAGFDVVARRLHLNDHPTSPEVAELIKKSSAGASVCVQHMLPHQMDYRAGMLNVGLFHYEMEDFRLSPWADRLNCMDAVWVVNHQMADACRRSGVTVPVVVLPPVAREASPKHVKETGDGPYTFYWIGELNRRKDLYSVLRAFHTEFTNEDNVKLVIKTSHPSVSNGELVKQLQKISSDIRTGVKTGKDATQEQYLIGNLPEDELVDLHNRSDCFVMASHGEANCIPAMDAMSYGNPVIVTNCTGFQEYVTNDVGWLVDCRKEPAFGMTETFNFLATGHTNWWSVDILHLRQCMREAVTKGVFKGKRAREWAKKFSYANAGLAMKESLNSLVLQKVSPECVRSPNSDRPLSWTQQNA